MSIDSFKKYDLAMVGSGFGGSLLAMVARRLGRSVVLVERGRHPRFVIGESSTPLANLILEHLARRYDLPQVLPLARYGTWQEKLPGIGCGLKRGFTFYHHMPGQAWTEDPERRNQLLVAASPNDRVADTQWYRPDFDRHLMECARAMGVHYLDQTRLETMESRSGESLLTGHRENQAVRIRAELVVDASGPRGCLHHLLKLPEASFPGLPPTRALFAHFTGVRRWDELHPAPGAPYPVDDAAVHHVFPGGWIWILRFNNGLTSAGVALEGEREEDLAGGEESWKRVLRLVPSVDALFDQASAVTPFLHLPALSFRAARLHGPGWVLLPAAAGFVDPLLSTGFTLNLLGLARLARWMEDEPGFPDGPDVMKDYAGRAVLELDQAARLVGALYACMDDFEVFAALTKLYFAAVSFAETGCRLGTFDPWRERFLDPGKGGFAEGWRRCCEGAARMGRARGSDRGRLRSELLRALAQTIEPVDVAGLNRADRRNWYPVDFADLMENRHKVGATAEEVQKLREQMERGAEAGLI